MSGPPTALRHKTPERLPLSVVDRFDTRRDPHHHGRYRLWFHQVSPARESGSIELAVVDQAALDHAAILGPNQGNWPIHIGPSSDVERIETLLLDLTSPCHIDMRHLHFAIATLAPALADAHFFAHSTGDGPDDWADEIHIRHGQATVERWRIDLEHPDPFTDLCERLLSDRDYDVAFRRFVSFLHTERVPYATARNALYPEPFHPNDDNDATVDTSRGDAELAAYAAELRALPEPRRAAAIGHLRRAVEIDAGNRLAVDVLDALESRRRRGA
ncbi:hypothetical protein [Stackebrandtia soli]|uniref:hypothetical protein n=1 Tax=Stackebrandtia soli TaxID=1892856 RepID=UPI0039ECFACC